MSNDDYLNDIMMAGVHAREDYVISQLKKGKPVNHAEMRRRGVSASERAATFGLTPQALTQLLTLPGMGQQEIHQFNMKIQEFLDQDPPVSNDVSPKGKILPFVRPEKKSFLAPAEYDEYGDPDE